MLRPARDSQTTRCDCRRSLRMAKCMPRRPVFFCQGMPKAQKSNLSRQTSGCRRSCRGCSNFHRREVHGFSSEAMMPRARSLFKSLNTKSERLLALLTFNWSDGFKCGSPLKNLSERKGGKPSPSSFRAKEYVAHGSAKCTKTADRQSLQSLSRIRW